MAKRIVWVVLENLNSFTWQARRLDFGVSKELQNLSTAFSALLAMVDDAENRCGREELARDWLENLKDLAYGTDDILNEWRIGALRSQPHHEANLHIGNKVRNFFSPYFRRIFGRKLKAIKEKVYGLYREGNDYYHFRLAMKTLWESHIYGMEDDKEKMINWLVSESSTNADDKPRVMSIYGRRGLGKTTLVKLIYNDSRVDANFNLKLWVSLSEDFDTRRIIQEIIKLSTSYMISSAIDLETVQLCLRKLLNGRRLLLVLDGLCFEGSGVLNYLRFLLQGGASGNRILVTTRSEDVARAMETTILHRLEALSPDDCWSLFSDIAFCGRTMKECRELEELGSEIVKRCKGTPVTIKAMASLMHFKRTRQEWQIILYNRTWDLDQDMFLRNRQDWQIALKNRTWYLDRDDIPILLASYLDFPSSLRECFAHCSLFPRGHRIEKKTLIQLWMAADLIPNGVSNPMQVGAEYFDELFMSFDIRDRILDDDGNTIEINMPDSIHNLLRFVQGKEFRSLQLCRSQDLPLSAIHHSPPMVQSFFISSFRDYDGNIVLIQMNLAGDELLQFVRGREFLTIEPRWSQDLPTPGNIRHLSLICSHHTTSIPSAIYKDNPLRTLICLGDSKNFELPMDFFEHSRFLRTLDLSKTKITKLPNSIEYLKYIRYLNLSSTDIVRLPKSLCYLYFLQTLILSRSLLRELPEKIWKLSSLRHLEIDGTPLKCLPNQIGRLTSLCILSEFITGSGEGGCSITELGNLNLLQGRLVISCLDRVANKEEARHANLNTKHLLNSLILDCRRTFSIQSVDFKRHFNYRTLECLYKETVEDVKSDENKAERMEEIFEAIKPHGNLKRLEIWNYIGSKFPSWIEELSIANLVSLKLIKCDNVVGLPPLGELRFLSKLHLRGMDKVKKIGNGFYGDGDPKGFPNLECLTIEKMYNLEEWELRAKEGEMPCLTQLILRNCPRLMTLPCLPEKLRKLEISSCRALPQIPGHLPLLEDLVLKGNQGIFCSSLPQLPSLLSLKIMLSPELTSLQHVLGGSLCHLKTLTIHFCPKLESLFELAEELPNLPALQELHIAGCPLLTQLFQEDKGVDWRLIARYIPLIEIDNKIIQ